MNCSLRYSGVCICISSVDLIEGDCDVMAGVPQVGLGGNTCNDDIRTLMDTHTSGLEGRG